MDKTVKRIFIGFAIAIAVVIILGIGAKVATNGREEKKAQQITANTELVKQEIVDPERIDFDRVKIQKEDTPQDLMNATYLLVRRTQKKGGLGDIVWEYEITGSSVGDSLKDKTWTKDDLNDLGVIVVALSNYEEQSYTGVYAGNLPTTITSEGIDIYYINTKTKTVFKKDVIKRKEFPKSISGSHNLTISKSDLNDRIRSTIRGGSEEKGMSGATKVLLVVGGIIGISLLIYIIYEIYTRKKYGF